MPGHENLDPRVLLEVIRTQTEIARRGLDLNGVMTYVAGEGQRLTGADGAVVELAEGEDMVYRAGAGIAANQLGLRIKRAGSLTGLSVATGETLRCDDAELDPRVDREACRKVGLRSMVVVPLIYHERAVGVLKVVSGRPAAFSEEAEQVLHLMSDLIAASIFHAAKYASDELYHLATHDALTGLANRALFYDRLRQGLGIARRRNALLGILVLDMDNLKPINDQLGHRAGDAALQETATRIRTMSRQTDTAARLGGDEFGVILMDLKTQDNAAIQAGRIASAIGQPFHFEGQVVNLSASVGSVVYPEDGDDLDALIVKADECMYENKRARKGG
ncbi:MAG: GGDEF domain-containing protein [Alphaproteobacteria bacterium]|nr:MAG: GGDEF domain-containing protein [Alphaproteobacteria bacterium]